MFARIFRDAAFLVTFVALAMVVQPTRFDGAAPFVWVAAALTIAVLLHCPRRDWPEFLLLSGLGAALAVLVAGGGPVLAIGAGLAIVIETGLAAGLLIKPSRSGSEIGSEGAAGDDFLAYVFAVGIAGPAAGAAISTAVAFWALGWPFLSTLSDVFLAHALGNIIFTPFFALMISGDLVRWARSQTPFTLLEQAGLAAVVVLCGFVAFAQDRVPLLVLPVLATMMATYRFGRVGAALSVVLLAAIGAVLTMKGFGPLVLDFQHVGVSAPEMGHVGSRVQLLQAYLAVIVLCAQPLARNIAERGRLELALREARALYRLLAENTTEIVLKTDADGFVTYVSPAAERSGVWRVGDLMGRHLLELVHAPFKGQVATQLDAAIEQGAAGRWSEFLAVVGQDGELWFEMKIQSLIDDNAYVYGSVAIMRSIAERKAFEDQLYEAGLTDALTGLSNRRAFMAVLQHHLDEQAGGCMALLDLDHFRTINDRYGHAVGDRVLILFGNLARSLVRQEDTVARIGGEKFGILLPRASPEQAELVCQRILSSFSGTTRAIGDAIIRASASAGVSPISGTPDDAMKSADLALYTAKAKGRDRLEMAPRLRPAHTRRW